MTELTDAPAFAYGWGSAAALIDVVRPPRPSADELLDRYAIEQTVRAYGWAIDEKRFDILSDLFAPEAEFAGVIAGVGPLETVRGREVLTTWIQDYMNTRSDQLRHSLGSVLITALEDGRANALAYLTLHSTADGETTVVATAFYRLALIRSDDRWHIDTVFAGFDKGF